MPERSFSITVCGIVVAFMGERGRLQCQHCHNKTAQGLTQRGMRYSDACVKAQPADEIKAHNDVLFRLAGG